MSGAAEAGPFMQSVTIPFSGDIGVTIRMADGATISPQVGAFVGKVVPAADIKALTGPLDPSLFQPTPQFLTSSEIAVMAAPYQIYVTVHHKARPAPAEHQAAIADLRHWVGQNLG